MQTHGKGIQATDLVGKLNPVQFKWRREHLRESHRETRQTRTQNAFSTSGFVDFSVSTVRDQFRQALPPVPSHGLWVQFL